jgi:hypothetical protein
MSTLDQLIYTAFAFRGRRAEARTVPDQITAIEDAVGGSRKASELLGVTQRTWQRWRAGTMRPAPARAAQLAVAQRLILVPASRIERQIETNSPVIRWFNQYDRRMRTTDARALKWADGGVRRVWERWQLGDDTGARETFLDSIGDPFYRRAIDQSNQPDGIESDLKRITFLQTRG